MIYLFYGTVDYLIEEEIKQIIKKEQIEEITCNQYSLETDRFQDIIEDATTVSLFAPKKLLLLSEATIFTGLNKKGTPEQDITLWENYFQNPNPDTILIFKVHHEKLDERKKIVKQIKKSGIVKEFNNANPEKLVGELFADYPIDSTAIRLFIDRIGTDIYQLKQEVDKMKTYKEPGSPITKEDVLLLTTKKIDTDIFALIDSIVTHNQHQAITVYQEMLKQNEEPIKIVVMLANQFRILYQSKRLNHLGHSEKDIAAILNIHPYRVKLALQKSHHYSEKLLLQFLDTLAQMDMNIKTGKVDKNLALELFILAN